MKRLIILIILLAAMPAYTQSYYSMGRSAYTYKNYDKAREMFQKDIAENDRGDSFYFLGEIEKLEKNYDLAITYFQGAISKNTTRKYLVNAYWNLIILFEERGDYGSVIKYCRQMWQKTGDRSAKRKIESLTNKLLWTSNEEAINKYKNGMEALVKGNKEDAMKLFREAIYIDSSFLAPKFELGMYAYNRGNENEALEYLSPIVSRIPYYTEVQLIVANINFSRRNYSSAVTNYTAIIEFGFPDKQTETDAYLKRGICYYNTGDFDKAENDIASVSESIKNDTEPLIILSAIYIKKKNLDEALKILARAESISHDDPVILYQTGSIYYYRDDPRFISYFDRLHNAVAGKGSGEYDKYLKAFKILLTAHFEKKHYSKVIEISDIYLKETEDYDVLLMSARSYFFLERYEQAVIKFEKISLKRDDELYLTIAYSRTGRKEKSIEILKRIITDQDIRKKAMQDRVLKSYIEEIERRDNQNNIKQ